MVTPSSGPSSPRRLLGLLHPEDECTTTLRNVGTICQSTQITSNTTWLFSILVYHHISAEVLVLIELHFWNEHFMLAPIEIITIMPQVHNSRQVAWATGFSTMMPNTCWALERNSIHVIFLWPTILGWPLDFWSLCTPALRNYALFRHCGTHQMEAATLSVKERKSVVSSGDVTMPSAMAKKPVYKRRVHRHSWIRSIVRSFIHSSREFCYGNTLARG